MYRLYSKYPEDLDPIGVLVHDHIQKMGTDLVDKARGENQPAADAKPAPAAGADAKDGMCLRAALLVVLLHTSVCFLT